SNVIQAGHDLAHVLVAEMIVEPEVTADEIAGGIFPELDVRMLLEFAERLRNVAALGNVLPITTMDEWARFRRITASTGSTGNGGTPEPDAVPDVPDPDDGAL